MREDLQIHFLSIGAISGDGAAKGHLVIEASSDASPGDTIQLLLTKLDPWLQPVFAAAGLPNSNLARLLGDHVVTSGTRLRDNAGLDFTGTPGMTVKRIRREYDLARKVRTLFDDKAYDGSAVEVLASVRAEIEQDPKLAPLLTPEPAPFLVETKATSFLSSAPALIGGAIVRFFWPLLLVCLLLALAAVAAAYHWSGWVSAVLTLLVAAGLVLVALVVRLVLILTKLTALEKADIQDDSIPNEAVLREVVRRENKVMQNHMTGVSRIKPAPLRRFTLKLAFCVIGTLSARFRPGYLADIGTIHFARWVVLPGTDQLIFFSNYGGSWESYLEDFITKAHERPDRRVEQHRGLSADRPICSSRAPPTASPSSAGRAASSGRPISGIAPIRTSPPTASAPTPRSARAWPPPRPRTRPRPGSPISARACRRPARSTRPRSRPSSSAASSIILMPRA